MRSTTEATPPSCQHMVALAAKSWIMWFPLPISWRKMAQVRCYMASSPRNMQFLAVTRNAKVIRLAPVFYFSVKLCKTVASLRLTPCFTSDRRYHRKTAMTMMQMMMPLMIVWQSHRNRQLVPSNLFWISSWNRQAKDLQKTTWLLQSFTITSIVATIGQSTSAIKSTSWGLWSTQTILTC